MPFVRTRLRLSASCFLALLYSGLHVLSDRRCSRSSRSIRVAVSLTIAGCCCISSLLIFFSMSATVPARTQALARVAKSGEIVCSWPFTTSLCDSSSVSKFKRCSFETSSAFATISQSSPFTCSMTFFASASAFSAFRRRERSCWHTYKCLRVSIAKIFRRKAWPWGRGCTEFSLSPQIMHACPPAKNKCTADDTDC